jgi:pyridoxamine 5'-phosphate oxidase
LSLADLRREYTYGGLREEDLDPDPIRQFQKWLSEAASAGVPEPRIMILATASPRLEPTSRLMLLKEVDQRGFVFFGSSQGRKGQDLAQNNWAALNFPWLELERQVSVGGLVNQLGREQTAVCFRAQPRWRRLAAHAFRQSQVVPDRTELERRLRACAARFPGQDIPLPPHWVGYVLVPEEIEFWQGCPNRLHDRLYYKKEIDGRWRIHRLSP